MSLVAMYIAEPGHLRDEFVNLFIVFIGMCCIAAWLKLHVPLAAVLMAVGCAVALTPGLYAASQEDLGELGDMWRRLTQADNTDGHFACVVYMELEEGKLIGFLGMASALAGYAIVHKLVSRRDKSRDVPEVAIIPTSSESAPS